MDLKIDKEKRKCDLFPFYLFEVCTVEIRNLVALCLEVKMTTNVLYANVPNLTVSKNDLKSTDFE